MGASGHAIGFDGALICRGVLTALAGLATRAAPSDPPRSHCRDLSVPPATGTLTQPLPFTVTVISWTPAGSSARRDSLGPKKNRASPAIRAQAGQAGIQARRWIEMSELGPWSQPSTVSPASSDCRDGPNGLVRCRSRTTAHQRTFPEAGTRRSGHAGESGQRPSSGECGHRPGYGPSNSRTAAPA